MFSLRILVAVCIAIISKSECEGMNFYEDIMDKNLDVREFLGNNKMVHIYAKCLIEDGPCPAMAVRLRSIFCLFIII